jgi:hypothetical protein
MTRDGNASRRTRQETADLVSVADFRQFAISKSVSKSSQSGQIRSSGLRVPQMSAGWTKGHFPGGVLTPYVKKPATETQIRIPMRHPISNFGEKNSGSRSELVPLLVCRITRTTLTGGWGQSPLCIQGLTSIRARRMRLTPRGRMIIFEAPKRFANSIGSMISPPLTERFGGPMGVRV